MGKQGCQRTGLHFDKNMFSKSLVIKDETTRGFRGFIRETKGWMVGESRNVGLFDSKAQS